MGEEWAAASRYSRLCRDVEEEEEEEDVDR